MGKVKVTQLCLTLCDPMDYTVHSILQARILEWVDFPFSRGSSQPRDQTQVSSIEGRILYTLSNQGSINTECIVSHYSCAFSYMLLLFSMIFLFCTCENLVLDLMEAIVLSSLPDMSNRKDDNCGV